MCGCKNKNIPKYSGDSNIFKSNPSASSSYGNNLLISKKLTPEEIRQEFLRRLNAGTSSN